MNDRHAPLTEMAEVAANAAKRRQRTEPEK